MRIPRIYTPQPLTSHSSLELEQEASHHILKVLRMSAGRELILFNGQGQECSAVIVEAGKKSAILEIHAVATLSRESPLMTELAIGISRGERMDWVLQKATELGVTRIIPLFTERTEVKLQGDRLQKKMEQWQKILQGACEQCLRNTLPQLLTPCSLDSYLNTTQTEKRYVLHHRSDENLHHTEKPGSVALLIGPEGGLSEAEIALAEKSHFAHLTLGPRVLRTETAPIVALSLMQFCWGDF